MNGRFIPLSGRTPRCPRAFLFTAILLALLLSGGCKRRGEQAPAVEDGTRRVRLDPTVAKPMLEFPRPVQSEDTSLNKFIEEFYGVCCRGEYDRFRLMMSTRVDPFTPERFKKAMTAVERVRIEAIEELPEVADVPPPVYVVRSQVHLRPGEKRGQLERTVTILVFKEADKWVMAPAPKHLLRELDLLTGTEEEPNEEPPVQDTHRSKARALSPMTPDG